MSPKKINTFWHLRFDISHGSPTVRFTRHGSFSWTDFNFRKKKCEKIFRAVCNLAENKIKTKKNYNFFFSFSFEWKEVSCCVECERRIKYSVNASIYFRTRHHIHTHFADIGIYVCIFDDRMTCSRLSATRKALKVIRRVERSTFLIFFILGKKNQQKKREANPSKNDSNIFSNWSHSSFQIIILAAIKLNSIVKVKSTKNVVNLHKCVREVASDIVTNFSGISAEHTAVKSKS